MKSVKNEWRGNGLDTSVMSGAPMPSVDVKTPEGLLSLFMSTEPTPMMEIMGMGAKVWAKDERTRGGLGSFKALGAAYVITHAASSTGSQDIDNSLAGKTFVTASAGNHGLSVAAGAQVFGAKAVVYLADTVPEGFAMRLRDKGATVVREGAEYEASMTAAMKAADDNGWTLLSDSSWPGYFDLPYRLMEGYLVMAAEAVRQMPEPPTHIMLQAGVGGLAGACAAYFRHAWGDAPEIIVVEPEAAPALVASIQAGRSVVSEGPVSNMGRLDCKEPSLIALNGLARDADHFVTITEQEATDILAPVGAQGAATTQSGGAGLAAVKAMNWDSDARILCFISEEAEA